MNIVLTEDQLSFITKSINEQSIDINQEHGISNLFRKISKTFPDEDCDKDGLYQSLSMIGPGKISSNDKDGDRLTYKELMNDDEIIFVVHGSYLNSPYQHNKGYRYEIGVYKNINQDSEFSGAHGGITLRDHPVLFRYSGSEKLYYNKMIIVEVCKILKDTLFK